MPFHSRAWPDQLYGIVRPRCVERERERERDCPCLVSEGEPIDEIYYDEMHGKSYQENTVRLF
jgi:hypothetical protein